MDINNIKKLVNILEDSALEKLHVKTSEIDVLLEKRRTAEVLNEVTSISTLPPTSTSKEITSIEATEDKVVEENNTMINAPLVGVYYQSSSPESESFVKIGDSVEKGETLCIIEAMKVMNEIKAPCNGVIKKIHTNNGEMVSYNQLLMEIGE